MADSRPSEAAAPAVLATTFVCGQGAVQGAQVTNSKAYASLGFLSRLVDLAELDASDSSR